MLSTAATSQIITIWKNYLESNRVVFDTKGKRIDEIDGRRISAIKDLKQIIQGFMDGKINVSEFKTTIDSYNKKNNLWGFTATKGQMFFNQILKCDDKEIPRVTEILRLVIAEPKDLNEALSKISTLEKYTSDRFKQADDKRKSPNPKSTSYFLSYFWQIADNEKWPIAYTSIINAFTKLELWNEPVSQREAYQEFFRLNEEVKAVISKHTDKSISNWDTEHAFWGFVGKPIVIYKKTKTSLAEESQEVEDTQEIQANFDLFDYVVPKVATLIKLGEEDTKSSSQKGSEFEKMVCDVFKLLDFDVEVFGQGTGRNPDAIVRHRKENIAFIVDAKAYSKGYSLRTDDRAIKEYINYHCPKLQDDGYRKIGFIIVSNSFRDDLSSFVSDVTWNTDIKRLILLTSDALLHLLAYKTRDKLVISDIISCLGGSGEVIHIFVFL